MGNQYIAENVARVRAAVDRAAGVSGRAVDAVRIVAVTKTAEASVLPELFAAGIRNAAENRWQVARDKFAHEAAKQFEWHFIGTLQTNKVKYIVPRFDWVHSVDRVELAQAISEEAVKRGRTINLLLQVNLAQEPQKHGLSAEEVQSVAEAAAELPNISLRGLMMMAPIVPDAEQARPLFKALAKLRREVQMHLSIAAFDQLSMGMSDDFPVAVEEGATMVRVGRKLVQPSIEGERGDLL